MKNSLYSTVIGKSECTFQLFIGARGVGKTYSALEYVALRESRKKFIYLRRIQNEIDKALTEYANPFKSVCRSHRGLEITCDKSEDIGIFYREDGGEQTSIGYALALSTFSKLRGMDFSDCDIIIFDEMIPERHTHRIAHEGDAFFNLYETINRNREFSGELPLRVYMLANAINLNNPILLSMNLVSTIAEMSVKGQSKFTDKKRSIYIELINNQKFRTAKEATALYRLTGGTTFQEQALDNKFAYDDMSLIREKVPLNEYVPAFTFGKYTVYKHKSKSQMYIAMRKSSATKRYEECDADIMYWRFAPNYRLAILNRSVFFDSYETKLVFDALTKR